MHRKSPDHREVAFWRYEQIEEALDCSTSEARGAILRRISKTPVRWPSGVTKRISLGTLYRWLDKYQRGGLEALQPKPRRDRGKPRCRLPDKVITEAIRLLIEDPTAPYTFLLAVLNARFVDDGITVARSTLHRRVTAHPAYKQIERARKRKRRRRRFVAKAPHDIWHTDAKGPVTIKLACGDELTFHVLSIIDDASRDVLAAIVVSSPDLAAAIKVFRMAVLRWGLPHRLYADRASIFDSKAFRMGLALLGIHRIRTKSRNAPAHGKIEAYHRVLVLWFTDRLHSQVVIDIEHLNQLLNGVLQVLYRPHKHRGLKKSPQEALAGKLSSRTVSHTRLYEAFRAEKRLKAHPKTGEVDIDQATYLVPDHLYGKKLTFLVDPPGELEPVVVDPESHKQFALRRAAITPDDLQPDSPRSPEPDRWGPGPLQAIYDNWCGQRRPLAEPGFGLPELYTLLGGLAGRDVPKSDAEAAMIMDFYRKYGPFASASAKAAIKAIDQQLGPARPVKTYLEALAQRISASSEKNQNRRPDHETTS